MRRAVRIRQVGNYLKRVFYGWARVMMDSLLLLLGLAALIKGADLLVTGATVLANRFGISPLMIGLTVVSFGTSMPELLVSLTSGLQHNPDFAIANIIGSNIANVLLVLGVAAIIRPLPVHNSTVVSEIPFSLTAAILLGFLANAHLFSHQSELSISQLDGAILLFFFMLFMLYVYQSSDTNESPVRTASPKGTKTRATISMLIGVLGLYLGGQWVVDGAVGLASSWGINDALIGLTIVAIGTSSPELVASAVSAYKGQTDIAVGNVVGSNIFNVLWVLGLTSSIVELPFEVVSNTDLLVVIGSSALIILALVTSRKRTVTRAHGVIFVGFYAAYLVYVIQRG
jgi:cation:H+ antiporter